MRLVFAWVLQVAARSSFQQWLRLSPSKSNRNAETTTISIAVSTVSTVPPCAPAWTRTVSTYRKVAVEALIGAGEVSRAEVERRKQSGH